MSQHACLPACLYLGIRTREVRTLSTGAGRDCYYYRGPASAKHFCQALRSQRAEWGSPEGELPVPQGFKVSNATCSRFPCWAPFRPAAAPASHLAGIATTLLQFCFIRSDECRPSSQVVHALIAQSQTKKLHFPTPTRRFLSLDHPPLITSANWMVGNVSVFCSRSP